MSLEETIEELRRQFGERILVTLQDKPPDVPVISTGNLCVDKATGVGGVPRGRITEIFGPEGGGKSTLAFHLCSQAQKAGGTAVYIDMEYKADLAYMQACGVDMEYLLLSRPPSGTAAIDVVKKLITSNQVDLIVVDSVAALCTGAELDAAAGDHFVGIQARLMSQNLKTIVPVLGLSNTALVFINQTRMKIGVQWGSPETTSGGVALPFYASIRMRVSRIKTLGAKDAKYGIKSRIETRKNCLAPPWQKAEIDIIWGKGIDQEADLLDFALETGVVSKDNSHTYSYGEQKLARGREKAKQFLADNPEIAQRIRADVLQQNQGEE